MEGNPYNAILAALRTPDESNNSPRLRMGIVKNGSPLVITVAGINLPAAAFRINAQIGKGTSTNVEIVPKSGGILAHEAVVTTTEIGLAAGDQVLLLTEDDQLFYILAKVVDVA